MRRTLAGIGCIGLLVALLAQPAVAHDLTSNGGCREGDTWVAVPAGGDYPDRNEDLAVCRTPDGRYYDNHLHTDKSGGGWTADGCREGDTLTFIPAGSDYPDRNEDLAVCRTPDGRYYDNRLPNDTGGGGGGWTADGCREGDTLTFIPAGSDYPDRNEDLAVCRTPDGRYYDNRLG